MTIGQIAGLFIGVIIGNLIYDVTLKPEPQASLEETVQSCETLLRTINKEGE